MNKLLKILVFLLLTNVATGQKYQAITGYGFQWMRGIFDSSLQIPTGSGTPSGTASLKSVVKTKSALFYDSTGKKLWVFSPKDSIWYQANGATNMPWDSITGKPSNFSTTYALSNDIQDSITARLRLIDTAGMLSPYRRSSTMIQQSEVDGLSSSLSAKLNLSDTAAMLSHYYNKTASDALLATKINSSLINANNGVAGLDAGGKVPFSLLPAALMIYKGTWNAATNTPTLSDGTGVTGWIYIVSTGGTVNTGSGNITYSAGDYAIYNGTAWERSVGTNNVSSVNGQQGVVTLTTSNISEGSNLYYTDARAMAAFSAGTGISLASGVITNTAPDQAVSLTNGGNITVTGTYPNFTLTNGITNNNQLTNGAGYITGNQTITLSGDITGSGTTAITTAIGALKVTNGMLAGSIDYAKMNAATVPTWNQNTTGTAASLSAVLSKTLGGAGDVNGILKANGSGVVSAAVAGTDYVAPSALSGYLPLSGGTLTGGLNGTTASFSSTGSFGGNVSVLAGNNISLLRPDNGAASSLSTNASNELIITNPLSTTITLGSEAVFNTSARIRSGNELSLNRPDNGAGSNLKTNASNELVLTAAVGTTLTIGTNSTFSSSVTASSFVKSGATSAHILAGDGSTITAGTNITISGGTISSTNPGGTVTSIATNNGTGITGGTITSSGTIAADTSVLSTKANVTALLLGKLGLTGGSTLTTGSGGAFGSYAYRSAGLAELTGADFTGAVTATQVNLFANAKVVNQTTSQTIVSYTVPNDGLYLCSGSLNFTANSGSGTYLSVEWTQAETNLGGACNLTQFATGVLAYNATPVSVYAKAGTVIYIKSSISGGTATYSASGTIQLIKAY